jgi:hypothetical protein
VRGGYGRADAEFLVVGGDEHRDLIRTDLAAAQGDGAATRALSTPTEAPPRKSKGRAVRVKMSPDILPKSNKMSSIADLTDNKTTRLE